MKYKKLMLVTLVLLAILTIGAVSASDDVSSDNLTVSEDVGEVSVDAFVDDEIISDSGDEKFAAADVEFDLGGGVTLLNLQKVIYFPIQQILILM